MKRSVVMAWILLLMTPMAALGQTQPQTQPQTEPQKSSGGLFGSGRAKDELSPEEKKKRCEHWSPVNLFAGNLWGELRKQEGNLVASPAGAWFCMGMLAEGADRGTREEMIKSLQMAGQDPAKWLTEMKAQTTVKEKDAPGTLKLSAGVWAGRAVQLNEKYVEKVTTLGHLRNLPDDSKRAADEINVWVSEATGGKVKDMMHAKDLPFAPLRIVAASAVHFKADWVFPFDDAVPGTFHAPGGKKIDAAMMTLSGESLEYLETKTLRVARLEYLGSPACSMIVMLPKKEDDLEAAEKSLAGDGLAKLLETLRTQKAEGEKLLLDAKVAEAKVPVDPATREEKMDAILRTAKARELMAKANEKSLLKKVKLTMPRFEFESTLDLIATLQAMGMKRAFSNSAEFGGICSVALKLDLVRQKSWIKVDEKGTEAGSATVASGELFGEPPKDDEVMLVDRPFLFAIVDDEMDLVLFAGRVTEVPAMAK